MKDQRSDRTDQPSPERSDTVESPMKQGQVEQVVCSADCRSVERTDPLHRQNHQQISDIADGAAGTAPSESAEHILSFEMRLLVALAGRGERTIGEFIWDAQRHSEVSDITVVDDEQLILALEAEAFR